MQKPIERAALPNPCTSDQLSHIAYLSANCWGVTREEIETFPCRGQPALLARIMAIAIAREILFTSLKALAEHFGADAEAMAASCNRVDERAERDEGFRYTYRFLRKGCAAALRADGGPDCDSA